MTIEEFSNEFDSMIASYQHKAIYGDQSSIADFTFNEYEKSLFLTEAQIQLIQGYLSDGQTKGYDNNAKKQIDFSNITKVASITSTLSTAPYAEHAIVLDTSNLNILQIINERVVDSNNKSYVIVPINYRQYDRYLSKAYSEPMKRQAWRLFSNTKNDTQRAEIILRRDAGKFKEYKIRYIEFPKPIILINLPDGLSIYNETQKQGCVLNNSLHHEILQVAVKLAIASRKDETKDVSALRNQQS